MTVTNIFKIAIVVVVCLSATKALEVENITAISVQNTVPGNSSSNVTTPLNGIPAAKVMSPTQINATDDEDCDDDEPISEPEASAKLSSDNRQGKGMNWNGTEQQTASSSAQNNSSFHETNDLSQRGIAALHIQSWSRIFGLVIMLPLIY